MTSISHVAKKNLLLVTTVSVSAPYQLSASHSSVVIMSRSKKMLEINEIKESLNAQHLGKLFTFMLLDTHLCHLHLLPDCSLVYYIKFVTWVTLTSWFSH